jgi:hypothetical protein
MGVTVTGAAGLPAPALPLGGPSNFSHFQQFQPFSAFGRKWLKFTSFSHFQLSAYHRKKGEGDMRVG